MEFNEKLQELRKQKGLTQEELAQILFVSRAAVSKWESGRGYPNIDSLKAIARFFSVTIDELLSGDQVLTIAEEDNRQKEHRFKNLVYGLLDLSAILCLFLPFFGQKGEGMVQAVSLLNLTGVPAYLKLVYSLSVGIVAATGLLTLIPLDTKMVLWSRYGHRLSLLLSAGAVLLFIISRQTYAASLFFVFMVIKSLLLINKQ